MNIALIFAGGTGTRTHNTGLPKQFIELYGKPIIIYTLEIFQKHKDIDAIVIPCVSGWEDYLGELVEKYHITKVTKILTGGKDTQESKMIALDYLKDRCQPDDIILLHDAVRPIISADLISANIASVKAYGNAITAATFQETCIVSENRQDTEHTIPRNTLFIAKAPQSFYFKDVYAAHKRGVTMPYTITIDTCSLMTELGKKLHLVPCGNDNIKITTPDDYFIFKALIDLRETKNIFGI